jgi:hypothetical protein
VATSIDNAGEERNCCFDIRRSRWPWCREDQRAYWLATGPSDAACLAHPPGSSGVDSSSAVVTRETPELPLVPTPPHQPTKDRSIGMTPLDVPVILREMQGVLFPSRHEREPGTRPTPLHRSAPGRHAVVHCNAPQDEILHWEILQRKGMNWLQCVASCRSRSPRLLRCQCS